MIWIKTAPSQNDARTMPQLVDWLRRFNVATERPRFHHFYETDPGGRKVKGDVQAEAVLRLFDTVEGADLVIACGAPVVKALLGPVNMAYVHGIPHTVEIAGETMVVFPMFDPAAGLASKGLLAVIAHDLDRLGRFLRGDLTWAPDPRPMVTKWLHDDLNVVTEVYGRQFQSDSAGRETVAASQPERSRRLLALDGVKRPGRLWDDQRRPNAVAWGQDGSGSPGVMGNSQRSDSSRAVCSSHMRHPGLRKPGASMAWHSAPEQPRSRRQGSMEGLAGKTIAAVDSEGWVEKPWGLQFSTDGQTAYAIKADESELLGWFNEFVNRPDVVVVMHNGIHDVTVLRALGVHVSRFEDTQLMGYHHMLVTGSGALESEAQNLGTLAYRFAGALLGELRDIPGVDLETKCIPYTEAVLNYAGQDAIATRRLYDVFWPWLEEDEARMRVYQIDQGQALLIRHMMDAGLPFDYDAVTDYYIDANEKEAVASAELEAMAARRGLKEFNPRSSDQVRELVTERYGLKVRKRTRSGKASTNEKALAIHKDHPFVTKLQDHRELAKLLGTYLTPLMVELAD